MNLAIRIRSSNIGVIPEEARRARAPSAARLATVLVGAFGIIAALAWLGRALAPTGTLATVLASVLLGTISMFLASSLAEWLVHAKLMHRMSRLPLVHLAYELHHRAHHWIHY